MHQTHKKQPVAERGARRASIPARDFERRCQHVAELLKWRGVADADAPARAWVLAFSDELDPTFSVIGWFDAGWRDPALVASALDICKTQSNAEACMALLKLDLGSPNRGGMRRNLTRAMSSFAVRA